MGGQHLSAVIDCCGGLKSDRRNGRTGLFQAPLKLLAAVGPEVQIETTVYLIFVACNILSAFVIELQGLATPITVGQVWVVGGRCSSRPEG